MRPAFFFFLFLIFIASLDGMLFYAALNGRYQQQVDLPLLHNVANGLGLTDLCVATEARYTRHPAVSDVLVPFMDHPGGMEHFPTGSFFAPPSNVSGVW